MRVYDAIPISPHRSIATFLQGNTLVTDATGPGLALYQLDYSC
jgi:hypothetical protein